MSGRNRFLEIKSRCLKAGSLYEDPEFPAVPKSVYFSKIDPNIQWRRPSELCQQPMFARDGATRFDLDQGALGDCWYIAAAATLATRSELFKRVVPDDQEFDQNNYAGVFHFNFWCFGEWREVIIDDRLPTYKGRNLMFCSNREHPDEFWSALLEKAYAKLVGSYEAMDGGWTEDALVDFTGGLGQRIDLTRTKDLPPDFWGFLMKQNQMNTLMGASINSSTSTRENELKNGLFIGHAYSITNIAEISISNKVNRLIRLRNPWGKKEWKGAWGDRSREWLNVDAATRQKLGLILEEDGEFWMTFEDWLANFQMMQLCHLPPGAVPTSTRQDWREIMYNGSWVRGVNAGGSDSNQDLYWTNSQYALTLFDEKKVTLPIQSRATQAAPSKCGMIVSLMQKNTRRNRTMKQVNSVLEVPMTFDIYKAKTNKLPETLTQTHFDKYALQMARRGNPYQYYREVADFFQTDPGVYVIVPSVLNAGVEGEYLLRIYTDSSADSSEMDAKTEPIKRSVPSGKTLEELFSRYAGNDGVIDARELQSMLNDVFREELGKNITTFDLETCRSLVSMLDKDLSGVLEFPEVQRLWTELTTWKDIFHQFDKDNSGFLDTTELKSVFKSIGYNLSRGVLKAIVRRYGGKESKMSFNDYILTFTKIVSLVDQFPKISGTGLDGTATFSLDGLLQLALYL